MWNVSSCLQGRIAEKHGLLRFLRILQSGKVSSKTELAAFCTETCPLVENMADLMFRSERKHACYFLEYGVIPFV